jgi:hypothetical protein
MILFRLPRKAPGIQAASLAEVILAMAVFAVVAAGLHNLVIQSIKAEQRLAWRSAALTTANTMAARGEEALDALRQAGNLPANGELQVLLEGTGPAGSAADSGPAITYTVTVSRAVLGDVTATRLESLAYPLREDGGSTISLAARVVRHYFPPAGALALESAPLPALPAAGTATEDAATTATEVTP